jgi:hypothetical protein
MAKPLLNGIFKVVALLMSVSKCQEIKVCIKGDELFSEGWILGRKALADEILKELNVDVS